MQRGSRAQVVGHPLQPFKKIQPCQPQAANERDNTEGQKNRRGLERLEFHRIGLNKKPRQLKAALVQVRLNEAIIIYCATGMASPQTLKMQSLTAHC
jgi:hypothetical protein